MDLFKPISSDLSMQYLYTIFGNMNGVIISEQSPEGSPATANMLSLMFGTFNSIILTVGVMMIVYVTVVGVMATAHEGEFMGKKWNNMWIPIRTVLGVGLLVPTTSGYSSIQIIMMWFIVQGVGAADKVWDTTLMGKDLLGSPFKKITAGVGNTSVEAAFYGIIKGVLCVNTSLRKNPIYTYSITDENAYDEQAHPFYYCADPVNITTPFCLGTTGGLPTQEALEKTTSYLLGPQGACGEITMCDWTAKCMPDGSGAATTNSAACINCTNMIRVVHQQANEFNAFATALNETDQAYIQYYKQTNVGRDMLKEIQRINNGIMPTSDKCETDEDGKPYPGQDCKSSFEKLIAVAGAMSRIKIGLAQLKQDKFKFIQDYCDANEITDCIAEYIPTPFPKAGYGTAPRTVVMEVYWPRIAALLTSKGITDTNFMQNAIDQYKADVAEETGTHTKDEQKLVKIIEARTGDTDFSLVDDDVLKEARGYGWIMAGSYYFYISKDAKKKLEATIPHLSFGVYKYAIQETDNPVSAYRNNFDAGASLAQAASGGDPAEREGAAEMKRTSNTAVKSADQSFAAATDGIVTEDPVQGMITMGNAFLWIASALYLIMLVAIPVYAAVSSINVMVLGSGLTTSPFKAAMDALLQILLPIVFVGLGFMVTIGATYAIYVPLIPYTIYIIGAIGWMTSTVEAMVAGPLVALGIISPSGQHELLGKAEPAIMLLFNIFLRPTLMIFGMIAAMLLSGVAMHLFNESFSVMRTQTGMSSEGASPLGLVIQLVVYTMMAVTILNKAFAAIHIIPERVMRWIGGQGESYGEDAAVSEVKGMVDSGKGMGEGIGKGIGAGGKTAGGHIDKRQKDKQDAKDKEAEASKVGKAEEKKDQQHQELLDALKGKKDD